MRALAVTALALASMLPDPVLAALPAPVAPTSGTPTAGDFIEYFTFSANDAVVNIGLLVSAGAFLIAAWSTVAKFMEARRGRAEWSEVGVTAGIAGLLMVGVSYLLTQSAGII